MADQTLSLRDLSRATLARQMLLARAETGVVEAVRRLAGMQAQEPKPPFIGLWSRIEGFEPDALHAALHDRSIVRGTLMRGTLHLADAAGFAAMRPALRPVLADAMRVLGARANGLDVDVVLPAAREVLAEGPLDFDAIREALQAQFPDVDHRALGYAVRMQLPLVMVPSEDRWGFPRKSAFTLADGWLGQALPADGDPRELVRRHLAAFGPATAADVQTWSGVKGLKSVIAGMADELVAFSGEDGAALVDLPDAPRPGADAPAPPRFLPEFDNLVLAHADRRRVIADEHRPAVVTKNLRVRATFLYDGFARGTWTVKRTKKAATLLLDPFEPLPERAFAELAQEGEALLRFAEADAETFAVKLAG